MLAAEEREFLSKNAFGRVLELGCWLGGSTLAIAESPKVQSIVTIDMFRWVDYMNRIDRPYNIGDSFQGEYRENVKHVKQSHTVLAGRLEEVPLAADKYDFWFIDAHKHKSIAQAGFERFFPQMRYGAIIMDQDFFYDPSWYFYEWCYWYALRDYVKIVGRVGTSLILRVTAFPPNTVKFSPFVGNDVFAISTWIQRGLNG